MVLLYLIYFIPMALFPLSRSCGRLPSAAWGFGTWKICTRRGAALEKKAKLRGEATRRVRRFGNRCGVRRRCVWLRMRGTGWCGVDTGMGKLGAGRWMMRIWRITITAAIGAIGLRKICLGRLTVALFFPSPSPLMVILPSSLLILLFNLFSWIRIIFSWYPVPLDYYYFFNLQSNALKYNFKYIYTRSPPNLGKMKWK